MSVAYSGLSLGIVELLPDVVVLVFVAIVLLVLPIDCIAEEFGVFFLRALGFDVVSDARVRNEGLGLILVLVPDDELHAYIVLALVLLAEVGDSLARQVMDVVLGPLVVVLSKDKLTLDIMLNS